MMDALGIDKAYLAGNSAGGILATLAALEHPDAWLVGAGRCGYHQVQPQSAVWGFQYTANDRLGVYFVVSGSQAINLGVPGMTHPK